MAEISIIGGINIDIEGCPFRALQPEDSNPGKISLAYGGVGRNIVENAARLGGDVAMISVIGDDRWDAAPSAACRAGRRCHLYRGACGTQFLDVSVDFG